MTNISFPTHSLHYAEELKESFERASSEALAAFGDGEFSST